jgi:periplasmic copper chaperone A
MKTARLLAALPALLFATYLQAEVLVTDAWVRGLPPGVANASAYMTLRNTGSEDVVLTGASSPLAGSVLLHTTMNHGGMLHMTHIETLTLPAGSEVKLESGGTHLMLTELAETPAPGTEVELTLEFADGTTQMLRLPVRSVLDE